MSRDIDPAVLPTLAVGYGRGKCSHPAGVRCELTDGTVPGEGHKHSGHWLEREACARAAGARALRIIKNPSGRAPPPVEMMGAGTPKCWLLLRDNHGYIYRPPHVFSTWQELAEHLEAQKKERACHGSTSYLRRCPFESRNDCLGRRRLSVFPETGPRADKQRYGSWQHASA